VEAAEKTMREVEDAEENNGMLYLLCFIMVALWNRADHYIFILSFVLLSFFFFFLA